MHCHDGGDERDSARATKYNRSNSIFFRVSLNTKIDKQKKKKVANSIVFG